MIWGYHYFWKHPCGSVVQFRMGEFLQMFCVLTHWRCCTLPVVFSHLVLNSWCSACQDSNGPWSKACQPSLSAKATIHPDLWWICRRAFRWWTQHSFWGNMEQWWTRESASSCRSFSRVGMVDLSSLLSYISSLSYACVQVHQKLKQSNIQRQPAKAVMSYSTSQGLLESVALLRP